MNNNKKIKSTLLTMPERSPSHTDSRLKTKRDRNLLCGHGLRWVSGLAGRGAQGHAGRDRPLCQPAAAQGVDSLLQQEGAEPTLHVETGWEDRMTHHTAKGLFTPLLPQGPLTYPHGEPGRLLHKRVLLSHTG